MCIGGLYNSLSKADRLRSSGGLCQLDLRGRLGFDLERMQTRGELLCKGGIDKSVTLHCRLRRKEKRRWKKIKRARDEGRDNERVSVSQQGDRMVLGC